ncbi:MAG: hypothetical protein U9P81_05015 [Euryarchaeota archaeon]|nr:hypothetical protein [Euryarchaeota archaeon]
MGNGTIRIKLKKKRNDEHAGTSEMSGDSPAFLTPPALSEMDKQTMPGVAAQIRAIIPDATILFGIHAIGSEEYEYHLARLLGKIKIGHSYYFTSPDEAVRESLKKRGEEPDRCSPVKIADEAGLPLAVVLEVIGGLLG